jgi:hypothetical protein
MADDVLTRPNNPPAWDVENLEQRVQRLEDAVASLQDTWPLEERVVQRVTERLQGQAGPPTNAVADKIIASPPTGPVLVTSPTPPSPAFSLNRQGWLLVDALRELRAIVHMFFDVRYHMAWSTRLIVIVLLVLILLSHWWLPFGMVPVLGGVLDKVVDLVLAFFVYKALSREAQRYLQFHGKQLW